MPRYIIKLDAWYLEWSTVVDAPVTDGMTLDDFTAHYRLQYGEQAMAELPSRLKRVEAKGVSSFLHSSVDELIAENRAGENEETLTRAELIAAYCHPPDAAEGGPA